MEIKAIVYTSNTGYTAEYARLLGECTGLPVYTLSEAQGTVAAGSEVIYLGWLMAGGVNAYRKAAKCFSPKAVCAVGLCETGTIIDDVRKNNAVPSDIEVFTLQGGYAPDRLRGLHRLLMKLVSKVLIDKINAKSDKTESDTAMLRTLSEGGSYVCKENLADVISWITKNR